MLDKVLEAIKPHGAHIIVHFLTVMLRRNATAQADRDVADILKTVMLEAQHEHSKLHNEETKHTHTHIRHGF